MNTSVCEYFTNKAKAWNKSAVQAIKIGVPSDSGHVRLCREYRDMNMSRARATR